MKIQDKIKLKELCVQVERDWNVHKGKKEYVSYLKGKKLSKEDTIIAQCYSCCNGYDKNTFDCRSITCPLYPYFPYKKASNDA